MLNLRKLLEETHNQTALYEMRRLLLETNLVLPEYAVCRLVTEIVYLDDLGYNVLDGHFMQESCDAPAVHFIIARTKKSKELILYFSFEDTPTGLSNFLDVSKDSTFIYSQGTRAVYFTDVLCNRVQAHIFVPGTKVSSDLTESLLNLYELTSK